MPSVEATAAATKAGEAAKAEARGGSAFTRAVAQCQRRRRLRAAPCTTTGAGAGAGAGTASGMR